MVQSDDHIKEGIIPHYNDDPNWWKNPAIWSSRGEDASWTERLAFARILKECQNDEPDELLSLPRLTLTAQIERYSPSGTGVYVFDPTNLNRLIELPSHVEQWVIVRGDGVIHIGDRRDFPTDDPPAKPKRVRGRGKRYCNGMIVEPIARHG